MCDVQKREEEVAAASASAKQSGSKTRLAASIVAMCIGVAMLLAGLFSWFEDEDLNNAMVQTGAAQAVHVIVEKDPSSREYALHAADIIDAAVEARTTSPDALVNMLCNASSMFIAPSTTHLLATIIQQVNAAYKSTDSENIYLTKLSFLAKGIREGVGPVIP